MDLSKLSEQDLRALANGDMKSISQAGLISLGETAQNNQDQSHTTQFGSGVPQPYDPSLGGGTLQVGSVNTHIPTSQGVERVLAGTGQGLTNAARHVGNLVGLESNADLQEAKRLDQPLLDTPGGKTGALIGETVATAPVGYGVGGALARTGLAASRPVIGAIGR